MHRRTFLSGILVALLSTGAFAQDKPKLPRVLIIGDSISLGYTEGVRKALQGKAEVLRPKENCQHTGYGLAKIEAWLGDGHWDVIHFNWGIWDTHMLDDKNRLVRDETAGTLHIRHTPEKYRENLTKLVDAMQKKGTKLVWASTTPIMSRKGERFEAIPTLNKTAAEIMKARGIAVNDLYSEVLPNAAKWQGGDKVHFNAVGNENLAKLVSDKILDALGKR